MPGFDQVADELYGLPPEEFTAARSRYEKEAKAAGNRDEAARIHALAKPSVPAWLANQLARQHRDELEPLLELGAGLRDATRNLAGDQLRELSRQQHQLVYALVQQARQMARAAGRNVSEDAARALDETLRAALADERAGAVLLAGRLTDALQTTGFDSGFGETTDAKVIPISRKAAGAEKDSGGRRGASEEERLRAERNLADAQKAVADAAADLDAAQAQASETEEAFASVQRKLGDLRQQLEEASTAASDIERRRREQATALERSGRALRDAERRATDAQVRRDRLAGRD